MTNVDCLTVKVKRKHKLTAYLAQLCDINLVNPLMFAHRLIFSRTLWTQVEASVGSFAVWHCKATVTVHSDCRTIPINHVCKLKGS